MKKYKQFLLAVCVIFFFSFDVCAQHASVTLCSITNDVDNGRLGDKLVGYVRAKWVAKKYGLTFYFSPFKYSKHLQLYDLENHLTQDILDAYAKRITIGIEDHIDKINHASCLYKLHHFFTARGYPNSMRNCINFDYVFEDHELRKDLRKLIKPRGNLNLCKPPKDVTSVAVHVRRGGGVDAPLLHEIIKSGGKVKQGVWYADLQFPLLFPPYEYYIQQIKEIYTRCNSQPLHIHIFTDDNNPKAIVEYFKYALPSLNLSFSYREQVNRHDVNVLEDLFSMPLYDCLIRSASHFSTIAELIGSFKIAISPREFTWGAKRGLSITKVMIRINGG